MENVQSIFGFIISLSSILGIFTGIINKLFSRKLKPLEDKIDKNREESIRQDMKLARYHVVQFASQLHHGYPHTREEYEAVFEFISTYERSVEELGITNSLFTTEEEFIKDCYKKLIDKK